MSTRHAYERSRAVPPEAAGDRSPAGPASRSTGHARWRPIARAAAGVLLLSQALAATGCYLLHTPPGTSVDGAEGHDGGQGSLDGRVPSPDATVADGAFDGGTDSALPADGGSDAEPPELPPPPPGRCRTTPTVHPFRDPVLEYRWPNHGVVHSDSINVCSTPLVIDLTPDGRSIEPVLVFVSYPPLGRDEPPGVLRIVDPRTDTTVSFPAAEGELGVLEATGNLAAGDIDGDGRNEIVGLGVYSGTYAFRHDGTLLWESPYPTAVDRGLRWARSIGGAPALADLEGDGTVEVVVGRNVLEGADGSRRFTGAEGTGRGTNDFLGPISCVADLDGDGIQEVIAGRTAFRADGEVYWNSNSGTFDGLCAIADVLDDPGPEVILSATGYVRVLDGQSGRVLWLRQLEGRVRLSLGGAPTVADFDGDGRPEIGVAHGAAYGVYTPRCLGPGMPSGCTDEGLLWQQETSDDSSSGTGSSVFDFNGDGRAEVVYNDQQFFRVYNGVNGNPLFEHRNSSRTRAENPTIADVDNDGDAEIIFSANAEAFFIREWFTDPGVEIWGDARGRWVGARRIWNQHSYHITNVAENGHIASPEPESWTSLNAYRQNLREDGDVLAVPDLWGGRGHFVCGGGGQATLEVNVQNWGLERAGADIRVAFYRGHPNDGGELLGEARTTRTLEPGGDGEVLRFEVTVSGEPQNYYAIIDADETLDEGRISECREDNNEVLFWRVGC